MRVKFGLRGDCARSRFGAGEFAGNILRIRFACYGSGLLARRMAVGRVGDVPASLSRVGTLSTIFSN